MAIDRRVAASGRVTFRVRIYQGGRVIARREFSRKADALHWEREQKRALALGMEVYGARQPVAFWVDRWKACRPRRTPATVARQESLLRLHVVPRWGAVPVADVRRSDVMEWVQQLRRTLSADSARQAVGVLRQVLDTALGDRAIDMNPAAKVGVGGAQVGEKRALTHAQIRALADACDDSTYRALTIFLAYTGLRIGEALALTVGDLDDRCRSVLVSKAYARSVTRGDARAVGPTKTHAIRRVPLPAVVTDALVGSSLLDGAKIDTSRILFGSEAGSYLNQQNYRKALRAASEKAQITPHVTPHQLRDTCASLAIQAGASVVDVARMLGHQSPAMTLRHYAQSFDTDISGVADALDARARDAMDTGQGDGTS